MTQSPQTNPMSDNKQQPDIKAPDANLTDAQRREKEAADKAKSGGGVNFNSKS